MSELSALEERRQRAREAGQDRVFGRFLHDAVVTEGIEAAIETATRVQITPEAIEAFGYAWHAADRPNGPRVSGDRRRAGLTAALRSLGFEVVE